MNSAAARTAHRRLLLPPPDRGSPGARVLSAGGSLIGHLLAIAVLVAIPASRPPVAADSLPVEELLLDLAAWEAGRRPEEVPLPAPGEPAAAPSFGPSTLEVPPPPAERPAAPLARTAPTASPSAGAAAPAAAPVPYGPRTPRRFFGFPSTPPADVAADARRELGFGIRALNDSLAVAAAEAEAGWTAPDDAGRQWGVSGSRLYLGTFSVPIRTDGQAIFSEPPTAQERLDAVVRDRARVQLELENRARLIRERNDRQRDSISGRE